jgi:hypothetical protein
VVATSMQLRGSEVAKTANNKIPGATPEVKTDPAAKKPRGTNVVNVRADLATMLGKIAAMEGKTVAEVVEECTPFRAFVRARYVKAAADEYARSKEIGNQ